MGTEQVFGAAATCCMEEHGLTWHSVCGSQSTLEVYGPGRAQNFAGEVLCIFLAHCMLDSLLRILRQPRGIQGISPPRRQRYPLALLPADIVDAGLDTLCNHMLAALDSPFELCSIGAPQAARPSCVCGPC